MRLQKLGRAKRVPIEEENIEKKNTTIIDDPSGRPQRKDAVER